MCEQYAKSPKKVLYFEWITFFLSCAASILFIYKKFILAYALSGCSNIMLAIFFAKLKNHVFVMQQLMYFGFCVMGVVTIQLELI